MRGEMQNKEVLEPKRAAIEAEVHTQQIYQAIANKLLTVERRGGRVYITRKSFERWKRNLEARRRMRTEEQQLVAGAPEASRVTA